MAVITSLVAYWAMNEAGGNALDSHGSNTLTENNGTIASTTGKVAGGRDIDNSLSQSFTMNDSADVSMGDFDFTLAAWVNITTSRDNIIFAKDGGGSADYYLFATTTRLKFQVFGGSGFTNFDTAVADSFGAISTGAWYYVFGWHDATANTINIQVNGGAVDSVSHATGVVDAGTVFRIGDDGFTTRLDAVVDECAIWKRVLTSAERTWLYNSGNGRSYADIVAEASGGFIAAKNRPVRQAVRRASEW